MSRAAGHMVVALGLAWTIAAEIGLEGEGGRCLEGLDYGRRGRR